MWLPAWRALNRTRRAQVASFMRAVLRTLAQCHSHHILHRDVKPGNFMLASDDEAAPLKAIDFGLAVSFDPAALPMTELGLEGTPWCAAMLWCGLRSGTGIPEMPNPNPVAWRGRPGALHFCGVGAHAVVWMQVECQVIAQ